jgi:type II secretory pathway pseudopilin PulG
MSGRGARMAPKAAMILATGKQSGNTSARAGFSLIEIVVVLGLMAFATAIVITNFAALVDSGDSRTSEEILQAAVREARFVAASERTITELRFDKESGSLLISSEAGDGLSIASETSDDDTSDGKTFALGESFSQGGPAEIRFYLVPPAEGLGPAPDASRTKLETTVVKFAPDRSSSPFVVDIDMGSGTPTRMIFDPFSSLLITPK